MPSPARSLAVVALGSLAAGLLAGCLSPALGPSGPSLEAPDWEAGTYWNYTLDEADAPDGGTAWVNWTVVGREEVEDESESAYRIRELTHRSYDHDNDGEASDTSRDALHLDVGTLHEVWNVCDEAKGYMGECQGRKTTWDFPLRDGKTWDSRSHGDVVVEYDHVARHEPTLSFRNRSFEDVWVLEKTRENSDRVRYLDVWDPAVDGFRYRAYLRDDPDDPGEEPDLEWSWSLEEYGSGPAG